MVELSPLYLDGQLVYTDLEPLSYEDWSSVSGGNIDAKRRALLDAARSALGSEIVATRLRAISDNGTLQLTLANGTSAIMRNPTFHHEDPNVASWNRRKFDAETSVLMWLNTVVEAPIPSILFLNEEDGTVISTLLPGLDAAHAYPHLDVAAKDMSVISYASAFYPIFKLSVPQRFGSASAWLNSTLEIGSYVSLTATHSFDVDESDNLFTFFDHLIESRRIRSSQQDDSEVHALVCSRLTRLSEGIRPLIETLSKDTDMMRFALCHDDVRPNNILLDPVSGCVTGIVDWEYHSILPACLAVSYPTWIVPSPHEDLRYKNPKSRWLSYLYESPEESERLKALYEDTVKALDEEYWRCLVRGANLRDALRWLIEGDCDKDPGCASMANWVESVLFSSA